VYYVLSSERVLLKYEVLEPRFFEVGVFGTDWSVEVLATELVVSLSLLDSGELLGAELFRENGTSGRVSGTASAEGSVGSDSKPRFVLSNMGVEIVKGPSVSHDKLVSLVYWIFIFEGPEEELVIVNCGVHGNCGLDGVFSHEVIFDYTSGIVTTLEGSTDSNKVESPLSVRAMAFRTTDVEAIGCPSTRTVR
jgi:hypothetical protein